MTTEHTTPGVGRPGRHGGGEHGHPVAEQGAWCPDLPGSSRTASHSNSNDRGVIPVAQIKRDHPIEQVIAGYGVRLRPRGRRAVGCCPFHDDEHPSLVVYPDTESFYCFGCRTGGDVITFIRRFEGLSFLDAVARLGGSRPPAAPAPASERLTFDDRMVLTAACGVYHETLLRHHSALAYLAARGVPLRVVRRCRLGFADGHSLRPYLERQRLGVRRATELGPLWPRGGETLAGRIVIPELRGGQCLWMLGRALTEDQQPKYLGRSLPKPILGYERVQGRPWVIVVEGAFDYLTGVGWGLPVCALLGTHVRVERLGFLERTERVALVFDADDAGRQAAAELAARLGERTIVVPLPEGVKDLSELGHRADGRCSPRCWRGWDSHWRPAAIATHSAGEANAMVQRDYRPRPVLFEVTPSRWDDEPLERARAVLGALAGIGGASLEWVAEAGQVRFLVRAERMPVLARVCTQLRTHFPLALAQEAARQRARGRDHRLLAWLNAAEAQEWFCGSWGAGHIWPDAAFGTGWTARFLISSSNETGAWSAGDSICGSLRPMQPISRCQQRIRRLQQSSWWSRLRGRSRRFVLRYRRPQPAHPASRGHAHPGDWYGGRHRHRVRAVATAWLSRRVWAAAVTI